MFFQNHARKEMTEHGNYAGQNKCLFGSIAALTAFVLIVSACGSSGGDASVSIAKSVPTTMEELSASAEPGMTTVVDPLTTVVPVITAPMLDVGCNTVGYVLDGAERGAGGNSDWDTLIYDAAITASEETSTEVLFERNIADTNAPLFFAAVDNLVEEGACIIFATSANYIRGIQTVAEKYPNVRFLNSGGFSTWTEDSPFSVYHGRMYEVRFLQGFIAAGNSPSGALGYVAPARIPEVYRGLNFFTLGAQALNPDIQVFVEWTNGWQDKDGEEAAANTLLERGVDVIAYQQSGDTVPQTVQTWNDVNDTRVRYVTYLSLGEATQNRNSAYLTGARHNWSPIFTNVINSVNNGSYKPVMIWDGITEEAISIDFLFDSIPEVIPNASPRIQETAYFVFGSVLESNLKATFTLPVNGATEALFSDDITTSDGRILTIDELLSDEILKSMNFLVAGVVSNDSTGNKN